MADKKEYVEIEGIQCEVKDPRREGLVKFYQQNLRPEIDKYIGTNRMTESKRAYADALEVNIKIAPFVLGWLRKPQDEDEYRVIKGYMTLEELEAKRKKEASGKKPTKRRATRKKSDSTAKKQDSNKGLTKGPEKGQKTTKPAAKKTATTTKSTPKNGATKGPVKGSASAQKKTAAPKKSDSTAKKQDSTTKKAAPKKTAPKTTRKKS